MRGVQACFVVAVLVLSTIPSFAAELLMVRRDGCPWCAVWERKIGPIYAKTDAGRRAPLRRVNIGEPYGVSLTSPVRYTPTFVLIEGGREIGRIEGYPGEDFFWGQLEQLIQRLPSAGTDGLSIAPADRKNRM